LLNLRSAAHDLVIIAAWFSRCPSPMAIHGFRTFIAPAPPGGWCLDAFASCLLLS
jgi:hypothetical protein